MLAIGILALVLWLVLWHAERVARRHRRTMNQGLVRMIAARRTEAPPDHGAQMTLGNRKEDHE